MSDRDDLIIKRLETLESNVREDVGKLHEKLEIVSRDGCPHHKNIVGRIEDHEGRIRTTESYQQRQAGQTALIGAGGGIIAGALAWIGRALLSKISL